MVEDKPIFIDNVDKYDIQILRNIPTWVQEFDEKEFSDCSLDVEGNVRYLLVDEQCCIEDNRIVKFARSARQPINMRGVEESSKVMIDFNPRFDTLKVNDIRVLRDQEVIDKLDSAELHVLRREYGAEANIMSGDITLSIILEDIKVNDIIEVSYTLFNYNEMNIRFFNKVLNLEYGVPVHQLHFAVITEKRGDIQCVFSGDEFEIKKKLLNGQFVYTLCRENVPARKNDKHAPYWCQQFAIAHIGFASGWSSVSNYISGYYPIVDINDDILFKFFNQAELSHLSDEDIVLHALSYVSDNIRYLSNYKATDSVRPADPNAILSRSYGDCKDMVHLLRNILEKFGVKSFPVLVHTKYGKSLGEALPVPNVFNHVILFVHVNDERYFIDPTMRQKVDSLSYYCIPDYGFGLICNDDSKNLVDVKNHLDPLNYMHVSDRFRIISWEDNDVIFNSQTVLHGESALKLINSLDENLEEKFWESLKSFYGRFMEVRKVLNTELDLSRCGSGQIGYTFKCRGSLYDMFKGTKGPFIRITPLDLLDLIYCKLPLDRSSDFYCGQLIKLDYNIDIVDSMIEFHEDAELLISDEAFTLSKIAKGKKGQYTLKYRFKRTQEVVKVDRYEEFCWNYKRAIGLLQEVVPKRPKGKVRRSINDTITYFLILGLLVIIFTLFHA